MNALATAMTDEEMREAAEYFAAMPWTPWIRVIETDLIPRWSSRRATCTSRSARNGPCRLPGRIIETPSDAHQANVLRNPRSAWIVYVPVGSLAKGKELVMTGAGKTVQCTIVTDRISWDWPMSRVSPAGHRAT